MKNRITATIHPPQRQSGFTIVELLIVIVIIGILATITVVAYNGVQKRANTAVQRSELRSISQALSIRVIDGESIIDSTTWRRVLEDTHLYDAISSGGVSTAKSVMICAKNNQYILGGWRPVQGVEADAKDIIVSVNGNISSFMWDNTVTGGTTLERFCKQAKAATGVDIGNTASEGYWTWMHNDGIKNAAL